MVETHIHIHNDSDPEVLRVVKRMEKNMAALMTSVTELRTAADGVAGRLEEKTAQLAEMGPRLLAAQADDAAAAELRAEYDQVLAEVQSLTLRLNAMGTDPSTPVQPVDPSVPLPEIDPVVAEGAGVDPSTGLPVDQPVEPTV